MKLRQMSNDPREHYTSKMVTSDLAKLDGRMTVASKYERWHLAVRSVAVLREQFPALMFSSPSL